MPNLQQEREKTVDHIVDSYSTLTGKLYKHTKIANTIHQLLAIIHKLIKNKTPYYAYKLISVFDNNQTRLY